MCTEAVSVDRIVGQSAMQDCLVHRHALNNMPWAVPSKVMLYTGLYMQ